MGVNDLEECAEEGLAVEIWRNRVIGLTSGPRRLLDRLTRVIGGPWYHLLLIVRYPPRRAGVPREIGRYEIYEPEDHPPRDGDWRRPANLGGFLQRRAVTEAGPSTNPDPAWDLHLVWRRNYPVEHALNAALAEESLRRYRWRDHYPRWWTNCRGSRINSNTFVEKVVLEFGLRNRDGSAIDLTSGGVYSQPGLGLTEGWEFAFDYAADTASLHHEWRRLGAGPGWLSRLTSPRLAWRYRPRRLRPEDVLPPSEGA